MVHPETCFQTPEGESSHGLPGEHGDLCQGQEGGNEKNGGGGGGGPKYSPKHRRECKHILCPYDMSFLQDSSVCECVFV